MWTVLLASLTGCGGPDDGGSGGSALCNIDADGDGFGTTATTAASSCDAEGVANNHDDCDDADPAAHPGGTEIVADDIDQDCDAHDLCFVDYDGDGSGGAETVVAGSCTDVGAAPADDDCDDLDEDFHPGARDEPADGIDQDCNGGDDCYADGDGDGFGSSSAVASDDLDCSDPGEAAVGGDCLDSGTDAETTYPGAAMSESDTLCMTDADGDGYGSMSPQTGVAAGNDCDDRDSTETCFAFHVGNDVEYPDSSNIAPNYLVGFRVDLEEEMTLSHLAYIGKASGPNVRMALYSDDRGPAELLSESPAVPMVAGPGEIAVTPIVLDVGFYWLMAMFDANAAVGRKDLPAGGAEFLYLRAEFDDPMPDPFGTTTAGTSEVYNFYVVGHH
jgi:hypothetical protein